MIKKVLVVLCLLGCTTIGQRRSIGGGSAVRNRFSPKRTNKFGFDCPQDFGYFPHQSDCTQYYVCVFGGAILESCNGGLMYSQNLQTCDWPRNVHCELKPENSISNVKKFTASNTKGRGPNAINSVPESIPSTASVIGRSIGSNVNRGPSISVRNAVFGDNSNIRQGRFIAKQGRLTKDGIVNSNRFEAQGTASRSFNVVPSPEIRKSSKHVAFQPPRVTASSHNRFSASRATTRAPVVDQSFYNDLLNITDPDYYYYYDDILYNDDDYYEPIVEKTTTARPIIRAPSRGFAKSTLGSSHSSLGASGQVFGGSPQRSRLVRPSKKPPKPGTSLITDIWKYPPRRPRPLYQQPQVDVLAERCDRSNCRLPDCSCGGPSVPGNIPPRNTPQIVLLTFDDSVNDLNRKLYVELFERGRVNPNGCPISATFYISHEWTDYSQVQNLYSDGHEIASHSITHSFGEKFNFNQWSREIGGQREIMSAYGGVRMDDIRGMRAPFLAVGGNNMFRMLYDLNFTYDSSMPVYVNNPPSWPYTLDYRIFHDCMIPPCPKNSYPGVWEVPMVMWQDLNGGRCSMGDACTTPPDAEGVYKMLIKNFERHYTTNRAPMGLFYHAAWFTTPHHKEGFIAFLDTIAAMDDVWLVTNWQALQWVRDPQPLNSVKSFQPFGCNYPERPSRCTSPKVCNVRHKGSVRYLKTCQRCPESYPWVGNTGVQSLF